MALAAGTASAQDLFTDRADYEPGELALIVGTGFTPGEAVSLVVLHADGTPSTGDDHLPWIKTATARGYVLTKWHVCEDDCVGALLRVTAIGLTSGIHAEWLFTDACASGTGVVTLVATNGSCLNLTPPFRGVGPYNFEVAEGATYEMTITGVTECTEDTITVFVLNNTTGNFCFNATGSGGTYVGAFTMPSEVCGTSKVSYKCGADADCNYLDTFPARGPGGACTTLLRASTWTSNCVRIGEDTDCGGGCSCKGAPTVNYCVGCDKDQYESGNCDPWVDLGCNPTSVPGYDPNITATDNCGPVPVTNGIEDAVHGCLHLRRNVHRAKNTCGEFVCLAAYLWVEDHTGPTIACPADASIGCSDSTDPSNTGSATSNDGCGGLVTIGHSDLNAPGSCAGSHVITRTWTATDSCGNSSNCVQLITVTDTTGPEITCPADANVGCSASTDPSNTGSASATDACSGVASISHSDSTASGSCPGNHVITRTWTATDNCGNSSNCVQTITVTDTTGPTITCPANASLNCSASTDPSSTGTATASDACSGVVSISHSDSNAPGNCPGNHVITRTWTATDGCGNSSSCVQTITVADTTGPTITCPPTASVGCSASTDPSSTGSASATDACSGVASITHSDSNAPGNCPGNHTITRTWTATDGCGNSSSCVQTITITDTTGPTITCPPNASLGCSASTDPSNTGSASATDACGVVVSISHSDSNASGGCAGNHVITRTWTATDSCGNSSSCLQTITVTDTTGPTISCPPPVTANGGGLCCVPVNLGTATASDNCSGVTVTNNAPAQFCVGNTTVTWTATDGCGKTNTCTQTVAVLGQICVTTFYDANGNGVQDNGEVGIPGWQVNVTGTACFQGTTDASGHICFNVPIGTYHVCNGAPSGEHEHEDDGDDHGDGDDGDGHGGHSDGHGGHSDGHGDGSDGGHDDTGGGSNWVQTTPKCCDVTIDSSNCSHLCAFGAYCYETPSGGRTPDFWGSTSGRSILSQNHCAGNPNASNSWRKILNDLNLRNANGTDFTLSTTASFGTAYTAFKTWMQGASISANMGYLLSTQLASAALSNAYGGLNTSLLAVVPGGIKTTANVCIVPFLSVSEPITCGAPPLLGLTNSPGSTACGCTSNDGLVMINDLLVRANCLLGAYGSMVAASTQRTYAESVNVILDMINRNGVKCGLCGELKRYVHSSPCPPGTCNGDD